MLRTNKYPRGGFTLIELLVVVLIIGILAAIALPQYKQVILKSRFAKVKANVQALASAMERYYMINNTYPDNFSKLDIEINSSEEERYWTESSAVYDGVYGGDVNGALIDKSTNSAIFNYYIILSGSNLDKMYGQNVKKGVYYCLAYSAFPQTKKICQQETGRAEGDDDYHSPSYTWYAY